MLILPLNEEKIFHLHIHFFHRIGKNCEASSLPPWQFYLPAHSSLQVCLSVNWATHNCFPSLSISVLNLLITAVLYHLSLETVGRWLSWTPQRALRKQQWWRVHAAICKKMVFTLCLLIIDLLGISWSFLVSYDDLVIQCYWDWWHWCNFANFKTLFMLWNSSSCAPK